MDKSETAMIADGFERILADAQLEKIDAAQGLGKEAEALWETLVANGYPLVCVSQEQGGFGGSFADLCAIATLAGRSALSIPIVETALANAILSAAGAAPAESTVAIADPIDPSLPVSYAARADYFLSLQDAKLSLHILGPEVFEPLKGGEDGAATPVDLRVEPLFTFEAPNWLSAQTLRALCAFARSAQMAGAMQYVLDLTLTYTQDREQFGRALSKFQAIQHHLSDIACETAAAIAAVELASDALRSDPLCGPQVLDELAIAKIRCGEAASKVAAAAHQAHGAMGFTREYALGRYTRRLWQWQDEFGSELDWAIRLGNSVFDDPTPALWPRISHQI